jgi:glycolate oxidase FAD binding subunit
VTSLRSTIARLFDGAEADAPGAPDADFVIAPRGPDEAARLLDVASEHGLVVLPWGGGEHQGMGGRVDPDIVLVTTALDGVVDYQPEDLTVVVGGAMTVGRLEEMVGEQGLTAVLPEHPGASTVGGAIAAAASPWRRLRFGPVRDRMLQVTLATGDGRLVTAGGRVVKNVTGYDIPRLGAGSLGSLGVIVDVCLKLWPRSEAEATVTVDDPEAALDVAHKPLAVLGGADSAQVYLSGTAREVEAQAAALGGDATEGLAWPADPAGPVTGVVRVPPTAVSDALSRLPSGVSSLAAFGVGEVRWAGDLDAARNLLTHIRPWSEASGGSTVLTGGPVDLYAEFDPWGSPPSTLALQRRIKAAFDPAGVMVPGRLPGGV